MSFPWRFWRGTVASGIVALGAVALLPGPLTGCMASACPFYRTSSLTFTPAVPSCLESELSSCARATLELKNNCGDALYVPVDYGIFVEQVTPGTELEVRSQQNLTFQIRSEKAVSSTSSRQDYSIPFRLGTQTHTVAFSIFADE